MSTTQSQFSITDEQLQLIVDADCDASWVAQAVLDNRQS